MSNYPPGVTGYERQIAGDHEMEESLTVDECQHEDCDFEGGEADGTVYNHETFEWVCPYGHENEMDVTSRYEAPEPDYEPGDFDW